jgi:hypothetical protein
LPVFNQLSLICPDIQKLQISIGLENIGKWNIKALNEKKDKENKDR